MGSNIALNKLADANSSVYPYQPAKAVDGVLTPLNRWVGSSPLPPEPATPAPNWLRVDLGAYFWINRWVVKQMGAVGWSPNYNLTDYKLQGSLDNANWFDIDSVTNNSSNSTDRLITPRNVRWVRIYITKGLKCNINFASIVDLELYAADPTSAKLTGLTISSGTLAPPFVGTTYAYTASVGYDTSTITVTPTVEDSRATLKVNGTPATSGQPSAPVSLNVGVNPITVQVTPFIGEPQNYTINVTRASSSYLASVTGFQNLNPTFSKTVYNYTASVANLTTSIKIIPVAEDPNATITVNGTVVPSGSKSPALPIVIGDNPITVVLTSAIGGIQTTYTFVVSRQA